MFYGGGLGGCGFCAVAGGPGHDDDACGYGAEAGELGVGESEEDFGIAADELDEEAGEAAEDEVFTEDPAGGAVFGAADPEVDADEDVGGHFKERGGLHADAGERGLNAVGEGHAPGHGGGDAVAAVSGEEAADAADAVTDGGGGGGEVKGANGSDAGAPALNEERADAKDESAEPGEAGRIPEDGPAFFTEFEGCVENVPEFGSHDACDDGNGDHTGCVGVDFAALEAAVKDEGGGDGGEPKHEAKGGNLMGPEGDVNIGQHLSIQYRRV